MKKVKKLLLRIGKDCEWKNGKLSWDLVRIMNEKLKNCYWELVMIVNEKNYIYYGDLVGNMKEKKNNLLWRIGKDSEWENWKFIMQIW